MRRSPLTYRSAALLALALTLLMHLLFLIVFFYGRDAMMPSGGPPHKHGEMHTVRLITSGVFNFLFSFVLFMINFKLIDLKLKKDYKFALIITCTFISSIALSIVFSKLQIEIFDIKRHPYGFIKGGLTKDMFLSVIVVISSQLLYIDYRKQQIALENEMLIAENVRTRYEALKNQIDPHFLFNSLNTLNAIIKTQPDVAQEYVQQLSCVFRHTLQNKEVTTLDEELRFTKAYCQLMQIRYGNSISFEFHIAEQYMDWSILSLSLQTLVENAIKHNVVSNRHPLRITVSTEHGNISVLNRIVPKKDTEPGEGIGLANLSERYRLKWQKEIIIERSAELFKVTIPLEKS